MKPSNTIILATVCMHSLHEKNQNLKIFYDYIDRAGEVGADLVVFPEAALQGYPCGVQGIVSSDLLTYHYENAETIPGPSTEIFIQKAQEKDIYIIFGMIEKSKVAGGAVLYNSAVLLGPEGLIGVHRKVHPALEEHHIFASGSSWRVFNTRLGMIGMIVCYDKSFPESARELSLQGAQIIAILSAWAMTPNSDSKSDYWGYANDLYEKVRALENQVFIVASGMVGLYPEVDVNFFGHSRIINPLGEIVVDTGHDEGMVIAHVDIVGEILKARTGFRGASNLIKDRRPDTYSTIGKPYLE